MTNGTFTMLPAEILDLNSKPLHQPVSTSETMTPKQYADAIERLGLSQRAAGAFLGIDERQSRRWIAGDARIPESVAKLLRLMIARKIDPDEVK